MMHKVQGAAVAAIVGLVAMPCWAASGMAANSSAAKGGVVKSHHATLRHAAASGRRSRPVAHYEAAVSMPAERATAIQTALIKQGYLSGEPSGSWDAQTIAAMQKMQADNGWQSKLTPDSRALIKLGLGGPEGAEPQQ